MIGCASPENARVNLPVPLLISLRNVTLVVPKSAELKDFTWYVKLPQDLSQSPVWQDLFMEHGKSVYQTLVQDGCIHTEIGIASETTQDQNDALPTSRSAISFCYNRNYLSITCRSKDNRVLLALRATSPQIATPADRSPTLETAGHTSPKDKSDPQTAAASELPRLPFKKLQRLRQDDDPREPDSGPDRIDYAFFVDSLVDVIGEQLKLFSSPSEKTVPKVYGPSSGLLVFSGATNCMKSLVSKGLVLKYMLGTGITDERKMKHLVTFEDPIEDWKFVTKEEIHDSAEPPVREVLKTVNLKPDLATQFGIWFTPRCREVDTPSLEAAVNDALRQTPACFFIGEVRQDREWEHALKLAATGHLVVVTTHAGSLAETFTRLFRALAADDEAARAMVVNSLRGVVHLKRSEDLDQNIGGQVFPSIWTRTIESIATLISDGIASVIPDADNVWGRRSIAQLVLRRQMDCEYRRLWQFQYPVPAEIPSSLDLESPALRWAATNDVVEF